MTEDSKAPVTPVAMPVFRPEMAFPPLTDEMVERLREYGTEETFAPETALFARGEREVDMFVVLEGELEIYSHDDKGERKLLAKLGEMQFTGELDLLSTRRTLVDGCTLTTCVLLRVPRAELQRLMRSEGDIADLIMQATIWRRIGILEDASGIVLLGHSTAAETVRLQRFLTRNAYPFRLLEPTAEQSAKAEAEHPSTEDRSGDAYLLPAVILPGGKVLHRPTVANLADELGLTERLDPNATYDITVVGAGPSGLAAAVYGASEGLSTLVIEGTAPGGQAGTSSKIENYLGFPTGVSGQELANRAQVQAQKFGARLAISRDVVAIDQVGCIHQLKLADGSSVRSRAVVIATGAQYRKLSVENYDRYENQGILYAATAMEANLCRDSEVAVIGGGNSAGQAAIFLSGIAKHVHLIIRGESLAATMSQYLISRIENSPRITLHSDTEIVGLEGESVLERVTWVNRRTGEQETRDVGSMFVMIGAEPNTGWLYGILALDKKGFVITGTGDAFENTRYATNVRGIYAVGDVRCDSVKRVASAVGEGSVVISDVYRYLARHHDVEAEAESTLAALQAVSAPAK
jgi:thioredoxin reductase (NADPH)